MTNPQSQQPSSCLVVDDEIHIRNALISILEKGDSYQPDAAADGKEALEKWRNGTRSNQRHDLMIIDLKMPRMDGEALIQEVRKTDQDIALIVLTGHGDLEDAYDLLEKYHISDFIYKPLEHPSVLLFSVKNALEKQQFARQLRQYNQQMEQLVSKRTIELKLAKEQAEEAFNIGLGVNAGHDLNLMNLEKFLSIKNV